MCGRFCLYSDASTVIAYFGLQHSIVLKPRYNIAPSQLVPAIRVMGQLDFLTWGLRPSWLKTDHNPFINARAETIMQKPSFAQSFKHHRCLIIANGYFEWKQINRIKQPYFIHSSEEELIAFAGIWDADACAIITHATEQQDLLAIHERKPLIVQQKDYALWLNPKTSINDLQAFMSNNDTKLLAYPVTTKVNNPKHDLYECIHSIH